MSTSLALSGSQANAASELGVRAEMAADVWDGVRKRTMIGGEPARLAAVVENIICAIQARVEPSEWCQAGDATAEAIERRVKDGSAVAVVIQRLRPMIGVLARGFRASDLGTDKVGRGAGWNKTANCVEVAKACNDVMVETEMPSGALFRALKDIVITALQSGLTHDEAVSASLAIGSLIRRRMVVS